MAGVFYRHDGFSEQVMNAMGIELEQESINDTATLLTQTGWQPGIHVNGEYQITSASTAKKDNILTYLKIIRQAPGAISLEKKWTQGVPGSFPQTAAFLQQQTGYSFPILKPITKPRVLKAIAAVIADNLDEKQTVTGIKTKILAAYIFTQVVRNDALANEVKNMAANIYPAISFENFTHLEKLSQSEIPANIDQCKQMIALLQGQLKLTEKDAAGILLALAASPSPTQVNEALTETILQLLEPAAIIEMNVWLSVLQLLHRLSSYYTVAGDI